MCAHIQTDFRRQGPGSKYSVQHNYHQHYLDLEENRSNQSDHHYKPIGHWRVANRKIVFVSTVTLFTIHITSKLRFQGVYAKLGSWTGASRCSASWRESCIERRRTYSCMRVCASTPTPAEIAGVRLWRGAIFEANVWRQLHFLSWHSTLCIIINVIR